MSNDRRRERMQRVKGRANWSAVAARAFEMGLGEIARKTEEKERADVVQRLPASRLKGNLDVEREGQEAGRWWAENEAEAHELERLANARRELGLDWPRVVGPGRMTNTTSAAERFLRIIEPNEEHCRDAAAGFWGCVLDDQNGRAQEDAFVYAFAEGALGLWEEVKDEV